MSDVSKFRAIPKLDSFKIPFKLEEEALLDWLTSLNICDGKNACMQIMALLQALNKTEINAKNRLIFLKLINEYLKQCINRLPGQCWDSGFPLSAQETVYTELITWNSLLLAQGFFITAENTSKKNEIAFALAMALNKLGQAQLHIAATYSVPNNGFWNFTYQIFYSAEKKGLLHLPVESNDFRSVTINTLFARSLIFFLCDTNQFQPRDTRTIFNFLPQVCVDLPITVFPDGQPETLFMLDLKYDSSPLHVKKQVELGSELVRYFSPLAVAKTLAQIIKQGTAWSGTLKSINDTLFTRVVKTLELSQKRKYKRQREEGYSLLGVIGFENIIGFLYKMSTNPLNEEPQQDIKKTVSDYHSSDQDDDSDHDEIIILDKHEKNLHTSAAQKIWEQSKVSTEMPVKKISLKDIKIHDTSTNGYSVSWTPPPANGKIGDLIGIISQDKKRLEIAIIRRIVLDSENVIRKLALNAKENNSVSSFKMGVEVIGFESEIIFLSSINDKSVGAWAVLIPGIEVLKRPDTVIYSIGKFTVGEGVYVHRAGNVKPALLLKSLHSTAAVSYVELTYPKN